MEHRFSGISSHLSSECLWTKCSSIYTGPPCRVGEKVGNSASSGKVLKSFRPPNLREVFPAQLFSVVFPQKLRMILTDSSSFNATLTQQSNRHESLRFPLKINCVRHGAFPRPLGSSFWSSRSREITKFPADITRKFLYLPPVLLQLFLILWIINYTALDSDLVNLGAR